MDFDLLKFPRILIDGKDGFIHVTTETYVAWATTACEQKRVWFWCAFTEGHDHENHTCGS